MPHDQHITLPLQATTLAEVCRWAQELFYLHARLAPRFARPEPRRRALRYLQGILSETTRKNGWQLAEHAREESPDGMQRLLSDAVWDTDGVRDDLRAYALEHLGQESAILVIDETSFPKRGKKSAGVGVQYCGTTGQVENCQVGVFLSYVTARGHTLIDRELYLPFDWCEDQQRCQTAGIPETVRFQTKPELAIQMLERLWLAWLDERADELVTEYLTAQVAAGRSAYTVQTERAALRLFFGNWSLAAAVWIPIRTRSSITRSRGPAIHDRHFQPSHWQAHIRFAQACGLRRAELRDLRVRDVYTTSDGMLFVLVRNGKGGKAREVPVLSGHEEDVLTVVQGRAPDEKVFDHIPRHMDVHSYRRDSAQCRYLQQAPGQTLPPIEGRLRCDDYDPVAVQRVSWALGHNRRDVVLRHYLR